MAFDILPRIQIDQHSRVLGDTDEEITETPISSLPEQFELFEELAVVPHLGIRGRKMTVPEQGELFLERALCHQHTLSPPLSGPSHFQRVGPQPIEKTIDNGLEGTTSAGFDLDPHGLAVDTGDTHGISTTFRKRVKRWIEHPGFVEPRNVAVVDVLVVNEVTNRGGWRHRSQMVNFLRRTAKTGPLQKMGSPVPTPFLGSDGRQVARP